MGTFLDPMQQMPGAMGWGRVQMRRPTAGPVNLPAGLQDSIGLVNDARG
jgi:hypothetical protein